MLSRETANTNCIVFGLTQPRLEPTIYRTRGEHIYTCSIVLVLLQYIYSYNIVLVLLQYIYTYAIVLVLLQYIYTYNFVLV